MNSHIAKKHPDISTSSLLEGQPDQRSHLPVNDDVSDECGSSTENEAASAVSSVRLLQTPRKQEPDKKAEFNNEDKLATASRKQYSRKRNSANSIDGKRFTIEFRFTLVHFIFYFIGKENLDLSEICDASKNDGGVVVEEQLNLKKIIIAIRRKSPRKKQMYAKCPSTSKADSSIPSLLDRSPSLTDRHSIESASRNGTSYFSNFINILEQFFVFIQIPIAKLLIIPTVCYFWILIPMKKPILRFYKHHR